MVKKKELYRIIKLNILNCIKKTFYSEQKFVLTWFGLDRFHCIKHMWVTSRLYLDSISTKVIYTLSPFPPLSLRNKPFPPGLIFLVRS